MTYIRVQIILITCLFIPTGPRQEQIRQSTGAPLQQEWWKLYMWRGSTFFNNLIDFFLVINDSSGILKSQWMTVVYVFNYYTINACVQEINFWQSVYFQSSTFWNFLTFFWNSCQICNDNMSSIYGEKIPNFYSNVTLRIQTK